MAFFGRRFDAEKSPDGKRVSGKPFWGGGMFGVNNVKACDWSRSHTNFPHAHRDDMHKFGVGGHPLEDEAHNPRIQDHEHTRDNAVRKVEQDTLKKLAREFDRAPTPGGKAKALAQLMAIGADAAKGTKRKWADAHDENFMHDFRNFLAGIGKRTDYLKGGIALEHVGQGKPVSRNPEVLDYLDSTTRRAINYITEIEKLKLRMGNLHAGQQASLNDMYLYFKYVVRNMPVDPRDFPEETVFDRKDSVEYPALHGNGSVQTATEVRYYQPQENHNRETHPHRGGIADRMSQADINRYYEEEMVDSEERPAPDPQTAATEDGDGDGGDQGGGGDGRPKPRVEEVGGNAEQQVASNPDLPSNSSNAILQGASGLPVKIADDSSTVTNTATQLAIQPDPEPEDEDEDEGGSGPGGKLTEEEKKQIEAILEKERAKDTEQLLKKIDDGVKASKAEMDALDKQVKDKDLLRPVDARKETETVEEATDAVMNALVNLFPEKKGELDQDFRENVIRDAVKDTAGSAVPLCPL
jgi:hypothetical protein